MRHAFYPLWRAWRLFITGWALREMNPTDPRVPGIVLERFELTEGVR
jgi:hypothetical protein